MPAFTAKLSKEEIESLVSLIRAFGPKSANNEIGKSAGNFETRFRQLQAEFDRLSEQLRELPSSGKTERSTVADGGSDANRITVK